MATPKNREQFIAAVKLHAQGRLPEAEAIYQQLLPDQPDNSELLHMLGLARFQQQNPAEGAQWIDKAILIDPKVADYHSNLGIILDQLGHLEEAVTSFRKAIELRSNYPEAHNNLGGTLLAMNQVYEAIAEYKIAVEQNPKYADAWDNLGSAYRRAMHLDESLAAHDKAIELRPDFAYAHYNRGTLRLTRGEYTQQAWGDFEWRWKSPTFGHPLRDFGGKPMWDGSDLTGKTILFHAEQGLGDTLNFVRYAGVLADHGGTVVVEAPPELASLLAEVPGVSSVIVRGDPLGEFDVHAPMMSVPRIVGTTLETIPRELPYILPPADAFEKWRQVTRADAKAEGKKKLRIGLVWAGNPRSIVDRRRSIPLQKLSGLADSIPTVRFYSLQLGEASKQISESPFPIIDHTEKLTDFVETAALVKNLDLIICVDTVIAHLAGALSVPTWLLIYTPPDWRWMLDRVDSPWYPKTRLFRQKEAGAWEEPIQQLAGKLKALGERSIK
jgi:Flp pilus assembly protein TadD